MQDVGAEAGGGVWGECESEWFIDSGSAGFPVGDGNWWHRGRRFGNGWIVSYLQLTYSDQFSLFSGSVRSLLKVCRHLEDAT